MRPGRLRRIFLVILSISLFKPARSTHDDLELTFEQLYKFGRNAYTAGNWLDCVAFLRKALADYSEFRDQTRWCRRVCEPKRFQPADRSAETLASTDADDWTTTRFMYAEAQRALCLLKCQQEKFTSERPPLRDHSFYEEFRNRRPYHYLQFCYWKLGDLRNAVSSAYTFLVANPTESDSLTNLAFYMEQNGFDSDTMLVDLLRPRFESLYVQGVTAYDSSQWAKCVETFESSFSDFLSEWRDCRLTCDDHLDWSALRGANPEFTVALTMNRGRDACQSIQNAVLLHPRNILTQRNKLFYASKYGKPDLFQPTSKVVEFYLKTTREAAYLSYVDEKFRYTNDELAVAHADDYRLFEDLTVDSDGRSLVQPNTERRFIDDVECRVLERAARFRHFADERVVDALIGEVRQRVADAYSSGLIEFHALICRRDKGPNAANDRALGCERGAFILNVASGGLTPCGAVMAEKFDGCALIFCTF